MNFLELNDLICSGEKEIVLDSDISLRYVDLKGLERINLDVDGLVIDGAGHCINSDIRKQIFKCSAKGVVLKNLKFQFAFSINPGSAVCNTGDLEIVDCQFLYNYSGDAVHNEGKMSIISSQFIYNKGFKGSCVSNAGELLIKDSLFKKNKAYQGAIYNTSKLTVMDSSFCENSSMHSGAIDNYGDLEIFKSEFKANKAKVRGGAMCNRGKIAITDSLFVDNHARYAGAIKNFKAELSVASSTFSQNSAREGGAILNRWATLKMEDCRISKNDAETGIIYNHTADLILSRSLLDENECAPLCNDGKAIVSECEFSKNKSHAIDNRSKLRVGESLFEQNEFMWGGAIRSRDELEITRSTFLQNASRFGGAIDNFKGNLCVSECEFAKNKASLGGAIYSERGIFKMTESSLGENSADEFGGAVFINGSETSMSACRFSRNIAVGDGGAIYDWPDNQRYFECIGCSFEDNMPEGIS